MDASLLVTRSPVEAQLAEIIDPVAGDMGYALVRLRLMGAGGRESALTLQIMAERPDGTMEIDDCAALSQAVSAVLDVEDPIDREYALEVSSPGIDRPLTRVKDFATYAGYRAQIEMLAPVEMPTGPRRRFKGDLAGLDGEAIAMKLDEGDTVLLPVGDVGDAKLVLTDELIAESLKGRRVPDASRADDIEYETEEDGGADGAQPGDAKE